MEINNMNQDDINKAETLVGYLQPLYDDLKSKSGWQFLPELITEAEEWLQELNDHANTAPVVN